MVIPTILIENVLHRTNVLFIDTRSPAEFALDHIAGAVNLPIFNNEERAHIGTLYKQDKKKAYEVGFALYSTKTSDFVKKLSGLDSQKLLVVYCWRGGLRSKTITELARFQGLNALQLEGGYKSFRAYIREKLYSFTPKFTFIVLNGLAGCGKTEILQKISPSIDLEGLAHHRGSAFGGIGFHPNNQKNFENQLYCLLKQFENEKYVFIEGENYKIGNVFIPQNIFLAMQNGISVRVNASIAKRVERIIQDYFIHNEDDEICRIIDSLRQALSSKVTDELIALVRKKEYATVSEVLLLEYYDSRYEYFLRHRSYEITILNDDVDNAVKELLEFIQSK